MTVGTLKDFLAEQAERLQAHGLEAARRRDEWVDAVARLVEHIETWLGEADPGRILDVREHFFELREIKIGTYKVLGLSILLGPTAVYIEPIARFVAGPHSMTGRIHVPRAFGRVDLTNGLERFMIFRVETDPEDRWIIIEQDGYVTRPFGREAFESALQSLLE